MRSRLPPRTTIPKPKDSTLLFKTKMFIFPGEVSVPYVTDCQEVLSVKKAARKGFRVGEKRVQMPVVASTTSINLH